LNSAIQELNGVSVRPVGPEGRVPGHTDGIEEMVHTDPEYLIFDSNNHEKLHLFSHSQIIFVHNGSGHDSEPTIFVDLLIDRKIQSTQLF